MAAATISLAAMTTAAQAQITVIGATAPGAVTFSGSPNGVVTITGSTVFTPRNGTTVTGPGQPGTIVFTTSAGTGYSQTGTAFDQTFSSGTFTVTTGSGILAGTFGPSTLSGRIGGFAGGLNLDTASLNYSPGSTLLPAGFSPFNGVLSVTFQSNTAFALAGGSGPGLAAFTGVDSITYSAVRNPVPEPSEWLAMGMAATSVGGLMFRARVRRRRQSPLAA